MEEKDKKENSDNWLSKIPLQSDSESYDMNEMISCSSCKRNNPPTRLDCLYCGKKLVFDESQKQLLKPILRNIEPHQNGYNLIYLANLESWNDKQISESAKMTRQNQSDIENLFESKKKLPIARAETKEETEIVAERFKELGIETSIVKDVAFALKNVSKRLRSINFDGDLLILQLFNEQETVKISKENIRLIVVGAIFERSIESTEKYSKKEENKVLDTAEISSDEVLIDIYGREDLIPYRISPKGFDFSFLGEMKELLAIENVKILIQQLKEFAAKARFDDEYLKMRSHLTNVWEVEMQTDSKGMERKSFGSYNKKSVQTSDNLTQFTKYSRLQWILDNGK